MIPRAIFALLLISTLGVRSQITLNEGDSYVHHFDTLPWVSALGADQQLGGYTIMFSRFDPGSIVRCDIWESQIIAPAAYSMLITEPSENSALFSNLWNDLEGTFRLTVVTGTVTISKLLIGVYQQQGGPYAEAFFGGEFDVNPPPLRIDLLSLNGLRVSWLTNGAAGYFLESANQIDSSIWDAVTNLPTVVAKQNLVTLSTTGATARFFRLRK